MELHSTAFGAMAPIPSRHTCDGEDLSPPLSWSGVPAGTASLALIVDDPDAPDPAAPKTTWVHWLLYNLSPDLGALAEDLRECPAGALEGVTDFGITSYRGPCPPIGTHRYFFKLYALKRMLPPMHEATKPLLLQAMQGQVLAQAELVGTYRRRRA